MVRHCSEPTPNGKKKADRKKLTTRVMIIDMKYCCNASAVMLAFNDFRCASIHKLKGVLRESYYRN